MEKAILADTGIEVSRIGLGTWAIGGWMWGGSDEQAAVETVQRAVDRGITSIDTAPAYGFGRSEEIIGRALTQGNRRERVVLATKVGIEWSQGGNRIRRNASRSRILQEIEDSLVGEWPPSPTARSAVVCSAVGSPASAPSTVTICARSTPSSSHRALRSTLQRWRNWMLWRPSKRSLPATSPIRSVRSSWHRRRAVRAESVPVQVP